MGTKISKATAVDLSTKRVTALRNYVKSVKTEFAISGVTYKLPQLIAIYQDAIDSRQAVDTKRAEFMTAMNARATAEAKRRLADSALKPWVIGQFGPNSQEALDFGFAPRKTPTLSPQERVDAVAQAKATREARGTMGKKARLKIKGVVAPPIPPIPPIAPVASTTTPASPATAPAAPATNPQPAQASVVQTPAPAPNTAQAVNGVASH